MQFESFHWLSHHGMNHYTMLYKYGKQTRDFWGVFILTLIYLGAFLVKQLFHSRLLDMRLGASLAIYHLISNASSWNNC